LTVDYKTIIIYMINDNFILYIEKIMISMIIFLVPFVLINAASIKTGLTKSETLKFMNAMLDVIAPSFKQSQKITLRGFGSFQELGTTLWKGKLMIFYQFVRSFPSKLTPDQQGIRVLERELAIEREERDILKKAAAYFAKLTKKSTP
jgi:hypothetical protein